MIAQSEAARLGLRTEPYPANWRQHGKAAGPMRNTRMLEDGKPELVFAFRMPGKSNGTDDLVRKARSRGIPTFVVEADDALPTRGEQPWEQAKLV